MADTAGQLEWERTWRPRAAVAAALGGALSVIGVLFSASTTGDAPRAGLLQGLAAAAEPGPVAQRPSLHIPNYEFFADHAGSLVLGGLLNGLGALGTGIALTLLARMVAPRAEKFPRAAIPLAAIGGTLMALAAIAVALGVNTVFDQVLDTNRTVAAVGDVNPNGLIVGGQLAEVAGRFALGAGWALVALHAMRTGLLTRFMGILGILSGLLLVLPIATPLPVVQMFWLLALAVLLLGRWPNGVPPAWVTGNAEPWPSPQRAPRPPRAQREPDPEPDAEPENGRPVLTKNTPHPASKKKRKRRR